MKKLSIEQAEPIRKKFAPDWEIRKGTYLYKKVAFNDYNQTLRFLMAIEKPQIKLDHFADFMNFYNELTIAITTHDVGGLTQLDFELALYIDEALKLMDARQLEEAAKKGLYHNVNARKKAGTSRKKGHPKAPSDQDWKDAAKTAKKESIDEDRTEDKEKMKGFDPETVQALVRLKQKFPQAADPLDALLKQVMINDLDSDVNDRNHDQEIDDLYDRLEKLEKKIKIGK